ncbi:phosphotransferase [Aquibacillus albus]|uniref:Aminoglycoside phosphotransferase domain-containing protein n=1 Tax=Aquibacillus albus TaxID=1168171 RepID=A0ABS2MUL9_9BACI|nr:phosphotransferase [Aquibacillus albus]MBM7569533.1 hypothetical protein [Aquibacillus albus]
MKTVIMINHLSGGGSYLSRLSSFLYQEGGLNVIKVKRLKPFVFYIETDVRQFILKGKRSLHSILQQWDFFNAFNSKEIGSFVLFPNGKKVISGYGCSWVLIPYFNASPIQYSSEQDRQDALSTIISFHQLSKGVLVENPILIPPIYIKWYNRLDKFKYTRDLMEQYGYLTLYKDILQITKTRLEVFESLDWYSIEKDAVDQNTWVHGDVASHNFMRDEENHIYLIDFDLLALAPNLYDYIQLGQRFLPFIKWNTSKLMEYSVFEKDMDIMVWLSGICVPSDIIREWLHFIRRYKTDHQLKDYLSQLSKYWLQRKEFVENVDFMLR